MIDVIVPSPGESITEVVIDAWLKPDGSAVAKDEPIADIQSDKATLSLYAEAAGVLRHVVAAGSTVAVGTVIARLDPNGAAAAPAAPVAPAAKEEAPAVTAPPAASDSYAKGEPSPSARKLMEEKGLSSGTVLGTGRDGRVTKADVVETLAKGPAPVTAPTAPATPAARPAPAMALGEDRAATKTKMTQLRKTIAARLVSAKNETAMLTTFNEVDMTGILELRKRYKEKFEKVHGIGLGFMGLFTKAVCEALREFPLVNGQIMHEPDGDYTVTHNYVDMGIAVSTDRGLMVPIVRDAHRKSIAEIEKDVAELAGKARTGKIALEDMQGGTFTITNGGVFGSLLSTPILNPPQSAILGMHKTEERPIALNGQVVIRPMMYVALSYDHRIIDGRESVSFLVRVKENLEDPARMVLGI